MSNLLEAVDVNEKSSSRNCYSQTKQKHKRVLKSKENIFKPKCNRELKKKLKKYKLRRDGIEDPDILDVSEILVTSLRIKSPNSLDKIHCNNNIPDSEEFNPGNYLIRMVRRKKTCIDIESLDSVKGTDKDHNEKSIMSIFTDEVVDKKHMDVFKLMMDARNKSIGSNSPGKEKIEEPESKDVVERKENKAKRILSLQKMAQSKGSLKNKEIEEFRDQCIEKKISKRAERFKEMLTKTDNKDEKKVIDSSKKQSPPTNDSDVVTKPGKNKSFKLCDIFNERMETIDCAKQPKKVRKEDMDFLNKLSPSIKKKENMLSYFKKMPKDDSDQFESIYTHENESVSKVKFNRKSKKKTRTFQSSIEDLHTAEINIKAENKAVITRNSNESQINSYKRHKRKRNANVEECCSPSMETNGVESPNTESRPKRNAKKPLKYTEDIQMLSSDEEFHIFTPKKKKSNEKLLKSKVVEKTREVGNVIDKKEEKSSKEIKDAILQSNKDESKKRIKNKKKTASNETKDANHISAKSLKLNNNKKAAKLAPIFVAKTQMPLAEIEAKQQFLKSGVPEKLRKKVQLPTKVVTYDIFPTVVHIQQSKPMISLHQEKDWFHISNIDEFSCTQNECSFKNLLLLEEASQSNVPVVTKHKPEKILKTIKYAYPKFPVYRTYHLLRGKSKGEFKDCTYPDLDNSVEIINGHCVEIHNENPDQLNWCDKYKPTSSKQIIGNSECIKELKRWLEAWTENLFKAKQVASDDSDFSDFYHSDTDSRDTFRNTNNVLILTGKTGSGKTSSVYAVASELAIKVIEVNASSKRTGKIMLQDLQEATQSHKVDRGKSGSENSQKLQEEIVPKNLKKRGRPKKVYNGKKNTECKPKQCVPKTSEMSQTHLLPSQESARTGMSLILIDDADIVFEQDDGFCSAISQLIQSSKRPVILITSSLSCPHLQRFVQNGKVLHMHPVLSRMLGTWLDVMCLADMGKCYTGLGSKMLDFYKGDIRKTINSLQFYMNSNKHVNQQDEVALSQFKHNIDDEDSSMSWANSESLEMPITNDVEADCYVERQCQVLNFGFTLNVFNFWWNLSNHYKDCNNMKGDINLHCDKDQSTKDISSIAHVLDTISIIDYFDQINLNRGANITIRPWYSNESASLLDNENFELYNNSSVILKELSDTLIKGANTAAEKVFKHEISLNFQSPSVSSERNRDKIVSRHNKLSSYLNPSSVLDRRATALDYWPICRTICRIEKNKTDSNIKRNNRFCHYLKSLNILGKNDFFDSLADSLS